MKVAGAVTKGRVPPAKGQGWSGALWVWFGVALVMAYTALIAGADGITKQIASDYAPAQLYAFSGLLVAGLSVLAGQLPGQSSSLRTTRPWAMAGRSLATVLAATAFFYAFRHLPLADVFLFVALMPVFSAILAGPILGERLGALSWVSVVIGVIGVVFLLPEWSGTYGWGAVAALVAALLGTLSVTLARLISMQDNNVLAQVFYPNLALGLTMLLCLPFVWQPMGLWDLALVLACGVLLFLARWLLVLALAILPTYAVTPLLNLQFVWMVVIGAVVFGDVPSLSIYFGMVLAAGASAVILREQLRLQQGIRPLSFAEILAGIRGARPKVSAQIKPQNAKDAGQPGA